MGFYIALLLTLFSLSLSVVAGSSDLGSVAIAGGDSTLSIAATHSSVDSVMGSTATLDKSVLLLPITIRAGVQTHRFRVEVARSPTEQSRGLMYRTMLPPDGGMIFLFPQPKIASFWMRNTYIPLDMIFIRSDGSIDRIAKNRQPYDLKPVSSRGPVVAVLELAGGTVARLALDEDVFIHWPDHP